jgi:hypothetical protein
LMSASAVMMRPVFMIFSSACGRSGAMLYRV